VALVEILGNDPVRFGGCYPPVETVRLNAGRGAVCQTDRVQLRLAVAIRQRGGHVDIGDPRRTIYIEPIEEPPSAPVEEPPLPFPQDAPATPGRPEPVPAR
jgi:hypothetical protein